MTEQKKSDGNKTHDSKTVITRVAEVDQGQPTKEPESGIRELREAVAPSANAADVLAVAITAGSDGEPTAGTTPAPPPGVQTSGKDAKD